MKLLLLCVLFISSSAFAGSAADLLSRRPSFEEMKELFHKAKMSDFTNEVDSLWSGRCINRWEHIRAGALVFRIKQDDLGPAGLRIASLADVQGNLDVPGNDFFDNKTPEAVEKLYKNLEFYFPVVHYPHKGHELSKFETTHLLRRDGDTIYNYIDRNGGFPLAVCYYNKKNTQIKK